MKTSVVYLLHFSRPYCHAKHYLGSTDHVGRRMQAHLRGQGARLLAAIREAGIGFELVRTWAGDRKLERLLKRRKDAPKLCPICNGEAAGRRGRYAEKIC
jgi:predicted GIY-YIG superfamily endonuclease